MSDIKFSLTTESGLAQTRDWRWAIVGGTRNKDNVEMAGIFIFTQSSSIQEVDDDSYIESYISTIGVDFVRDKISSLPDETLPYFFRRLAWSPDGSFLLVPAEHAEQQLYSALPCQFPKIEGKMTSTHCRNISLLREVEEIKEYAWGAASFGEHREQTVRLESSTQTQTKYSSWRASVHYNLKPAGARVPKLATKYTIHSISS
ncbi:hypothetical protein JHK82_039160 [Glycine max]|nr:hypothetical protein JHK86_039339 [Glycine max]KAG5109937.1 hypothetical protein JHK82_039160 [Glycine max]